MSTRILAIDTSTEKCSVAIWNEGEILELSEFSQRKHSERILPMVQQVLADSELSLNQLDVLAFGRGPGSFTGIRIGIGIAQGLALGADLLILGISTLETMAQGAWRISRANRILSAIDARMGEIYWGQFERNQDGFWHTSVKEKVFPHNQILKHTQSLYGVWTYVGTAWKAYPNLIKESMLSLLDGQILFPQAEDMLPIALLAFKSGMAVTVEHAKPTYLCHDAIWKKLPGRL